MNKNYFINPLYFIIKIEYKKMRENLKAILAFILYEKYILYIKIWIYNFIYIIIFIFSSFINNYNQYFKENID